MYHQDGTSQPLSQPPSPSSRPHVAIVGGGVSGLVAAVALAKQGVQVSLFERGGVLGGRIHRETVAGITIDTGAEAFATRNGTVARYLESLGLGVEIVMPSPIGSWVMADGRAVALPGGGTLGIPSSPLSAGAIRLLGLRGALRAACEPMLPRRIGRRAGSLAALVQSRLGAAVLERVVRPVTLGVHSTDPAHMPVTVLPALAAAYEEHGSLLRAARIVRASTVAAGGAVAGLRGGMGTLVDALVAEATHLGVDLRTNTGVDRLVAMSRDGVLRAEDSGEAVTALIDEHNEELVRADAVILAVSRSVAMRLAGKPSSEGPGDSDAEGNGEGDVEVVVLVLDDPRLDSAPRGTGVLVAPHPDGSIAAKALTHVTAKWPERAREAGPGRHVLRLSYGRVGDAPATTGLTDAEVQELAIRDASRILGVDLAASSVIALRRARWSMSAPQAQAQAQAQAQTHGSPAVSPRLVCLGDWISGTGLAAVILDAERTALRLVEDGFPGFAAPPIPAPPIPARPFPAPQHDHTKDGTDMSRTAPTSDEPGRVFRSDGPLDARAGLIRIGTRGSALALTQTTTVAREIAAATGCDVALIIITTTGDVSREPLAQLGGTGVFVSALRDALLDGRCDVAVHSLKDLPTGPCPGIVIGAIPVRADARDALCARDGLRLDSLPSGASVGTGSPRRAAQLLAQRADLNVCDLRGNVDTRLGRVGVDLDAVVLAAAGLDRIGRDAAISERFPLDSVPTAPGQGALAIEIRASSIDDESIALGLEALDHPETRACALAERTLLATLEAGCAAPIGAWARIVDEHLHLTAAVYRIDGSASLVVSQSRPLLVETVAVDPGSLQATAEELGAAVARELLAGGAAELAPEGALGVPRGDA